MNTATPLFGKLHSLVNVGGKTNFLTTTVQFDEKSFDNLLSLSFGHPAFDLMALENLFEFKFIPSHCGLKAGQLPVPVNFLIVMPDQSMAMPFGFLRLQ